MIKTENELTIITPDEGFKYVTNGEVFSKAVWLGKSDSAENWHNTNEEPIKEVEE